MITKLHDKVILALARYYDGCRKVHEWYFDKALREVCHHSGVSASFNGPTKEPPEWDRQAAIDLIVKTAKECGIHLNSASAGTFWFFKNYPKGYVQFRVNKSNYLDSGTRTYTKKKLLDNKVLL